jgi:3-dehydroquinate synthetase
MASELIYINKTNLYKELDALQDGEFFAVADQKVKNHLPAWIQFSPNVFWLSDPEGQKNLSTYENALEFFLKLGIHRKAVLYVFGGGATTDLGGFVAATILRGVSWRAVPTTLLAMVDGSLGGKVAVNTPSGKNLVGAFFEPQKIYLCAEFLSTLDEVNWQSGKGEILKYALLSTSIADLVLKKADISKIVEACAHYKMDIVSRDLREEGDRIQLNLGHTLGHAFETTLGIPHGLAVTMGMKYLFEVLDQTAALESWKKLVTALELPQDNLVISAYPGFDKKKFLEHLQYDKKRVRESLRLVLVDPPGKFKVQEMTFTELKTRINRHADFADR